MIGDPGLSVSHHPFSGDFLTSGGHDSTSQDRARGETRVFFFLDVPLRRCSLGHPSRPPLTLLGQNQPRAVRLVRCISSVLILRPGMGLPLWGQGPSTGCLNGQRLCGQRSSVWTSGHGCWVHCPVVTWVAGTGIEPIALG